MIYLCIELGASLQWTKKGQNCFNYLRRQTNIVGHQIYFGMSKGGNIMGQHWYSSMGPGVHSLPLKFNFAEPGFGAKFHKSYISWEVFRKSVISLEIVVLRTQCRRKVEIICVDFTSRNLGHVRSKVAGTIIMMGWWWWWWWWLW